MYEICRLAASARLWAALSSAITHTIIPAIARKIKIRIQVAAVGGEGSIDKAVGEEARYQSCNDAGSDSAIPGTENNRRKESDVRNVGSEGCRDRHAEHEAQYRADYGDSVPVPALRTIRFSSLQQLNAFVPRINRVEWNTSQTT